MTDCKVDTSNLERRFKKLILDHAQLGEAAIKLTAEDMRNEAIRLINTGTRSGATYTVGGKPSQRSAPGEPPKTDRGGTVRAFFIKASAPLSADLLNNVGYTKMLDEGTKDMAPRPFKQLIRDYGQKLLTARIKRILTKVTE